MIKMVNIDLDGTLLDNEDKFHQELLKLLKEQKQKIYK